MPASIEGVRLVAVSSSPSPVNSRTWKAWCTPCQPVTSSSKNAVTTAFGWTERFRPSWPEAGRNPDRVSRAGVCIAPPATTTTRARTVTAGPRPPPGRTT